MNGFGNDISEQYLNKLYEDLHKEQLYLMNSIKNTNNDADSGNRDRDRDITKQISLINSLMMGTLRLRNVRKAAITKLNSS
jgi:hypothetical protein